MAGQVLAGCTHRLTDPAPGTQVISFGAGPDHPPLLSSKDPWEPSGLTSVTVHIGDRIDVRPEKLIRRDHLIPGPVTTRTSEKVCTQSVQVCVSSVPIIESRCSQKCKLCEDCGLFGCHYKTCCSTSCENVHTGDQCTNYETRCAAEESRWTDESVYAGLGESRFQEDPAPMKSASQIVEGIRLKLESQDFSATTSALECALQAFTPTIGAGTISVTLGNVPSCPGLFSNLADGKTLTLINRMSDSGTYQEGRLIKTQDGRTLEQPATQTYDVPIDFVGSVTITPASGGAQ